MDGTYGTKKANTKMNQEKKREKMSVNGVNFL